MVQFRNTAIGDGGNNAYSLQTTKCHDLGESYYIFNHLPRFRQLYFSPEVRFDATQ